MRIAVYPGTFDPFTMGHMDILTRACRLFDQVYVAVLVNSAKTPWFSDGERREMIQTCIQHQGLSNAAAECSDGLLTQYVREKGACAVVRGVRDAADLAYEARLDCANRHLLPEFETVCLLARSQMSFLSAGIVREIASYGGDITGLVPEPIENKIAERLMNL